jgi:TPR repeat protein
MTRRAMRNTTAGFVSLVLILSLVQSLAAPLRAEPFDDAADAFKRGDYPTALKLLRPLADHGDPAAQNNLGVMYMLGKGVPKDDAMAVTWYRKAANQGNPDGQWSLGLMYFYGTGVAQDYAAAAAWFRKAADQGDADAQYNLGVMYYFGQGDLPQSYVEATKWLRKAANRGNDDGQFMLGLVYESGQGVPQDYVRAYMWYHLAAAAGNQDAVRSRDDTARHMTPAQIAQAQKLAREWKPLPPN